MTDPAHRIPHQGHYYGSLFVLYTTELFWLNMNRLEKSTSLCTEQKDIVNNPTIFPSPIPKLGTFAPTALLGKCDPITQFYTRG